MTKKEDKKEDKPIDEVVPDPVGKSKNERITELEMTVNKMVVAMAELTSSIKSSPTVVSDKGHGDIYVRLIADELKESRKANRDLLDKMMELKTDIPEQSNPLEEIEAYAKLFGVDIGEMISGGLGGGGGTNWKEVAEVLVDGLSRNFGNRGGAGGPHILTVGDSAGSGEDPDDAQPSEGMEGEE